jgi:hypothetical protein
MRKRRREAKGAQCTKAEVLGETGLASSALAGRIATLTFVDKGA